MSHSKVARLLPLAPHFLIALLGLAVCFVIACGAASSSGADAEEEDDSNSNASAGCEGYGPTDAFGARPCKTSKRRGY